MEQNESTNDVGLQAIRKPGVAANLSLLLAGLGQVYCGNIRRGLVYMWVVGALLLLGITALVAPIAWRGVALLLIFGAWLAVTVFSALSAYKIACRTREDYRLKDYNRHWSYAAFVFLFAIPVVGFGSLLRANFAEVFVVPTESMAPTIEAGSRVVVRKDAFLWGDPERNDLVAFKNPENRRQTYVKRVVASAGEVVEIRDGVVFVDGEQQRLDGEVSVKADQANFAATEVPKHHCFVLGDHRGNSKDSRHFGSIPYIALVGKVVFK